MFYINYAAKLSCRVTDCDTPGFTAQYLEDNKRIILSNTEREIQIGRVKLSEKR